MKRVIKGNIRFIKPVVEKLLDIHYVVENEGKEILKHRFLILSYGEFDKDLKKIIDEIDENVKLAVVEQVVLVNFGDEEIHRNLETEIFYDEEWIKKHNPDYTNFEDWIIQFVDRAIFEGKRCKE
ncbi:hypothetical protein [Persephonella sp.]